MDIHCNEEHNAYELFMRLILMITNQLGGVT